MGQRRIVGERVQAALPPRALDVGGGGEEPPGDRRRAAGASVTAGFSSAPPRRTHPAGTVSRSAV
jgi:hypothetical protein